MESRFPGVPAPAENPADYLESNSQALNETTEYARLMRFMLPVSNPSIRALSAEALLLFIKQRAICPTRQRRSRFLNAHMWSVIALSVQADPIHMALRWLLSRQNSDGGFGWLEGIAVMLMIPNWDYGLRCWGKTDSPAIEKAVKYLQSCQTQDGGFSCGDEWMGSESNAFLMPGDTGLDSSRRGFAGGREVNGQLDTADTRQR